MSERCRILACGDYRDVEVGDKVLMRARDGPVYYSQDSIRTEFRDGTRVKSQWGHWMRSSYDIEAMIHNGHLYSLNNRTLYAANHFDKVGNPAYLHVTVVEKPCDWKSRFTTKNGGTSIELRGGDGEGCCVM
mmetsp:Transcript_38394/g.109566  ORF Transcript_38394/g.109566 Transcript_38394/m.109566 type:complete len:132 (+) Transcript_38394:51-446(+)|eukprot:CAMPEP_0168400132 /NCGR_PEP_ID=MMETSP0228-20121227/22442_1 /TAXON_ID=133427 /ORGANISM="Protoceratium reticulatum, Strain CCCM 535 (=CCMP 1889)" /LENGTH=131 /DNA_ID=CAMNT_0008413667 /DNA_START=50 /DNA_END=445 /DNA_ORIENTATION=-